MRITWKKRRILLVVGLALLGGSVMFCSPAYVLRAGLEEARILTRRQAIQRVIDSPGTDERTRGKLALVQDARTFAERELGLEPGDSYTTYSELESDTLLMVVTAAPKTSFTPYTWWFPIVGRVPYKGYFDPEDALAEARRLEVRGFDTAVRPSGAFSTLGWFNDPLLSTTLRYDDVGLATTVIHEITHNTTFITGQVAFNESFANFVGTVGAAEYFCLLEGDDAERCRHARARWHDDLVFARALDGLIGGLEEIYGDPELDRAAKIERRDTFMDRWRTRYAREVVPRLRVSHRAFHEGTINNASLMGRRLYYQELELFDRVYHQHRDAGVPLAEAIARMIEAAESSPDTPFEAVRRLADS